MNFIPSCQAIVLYVYAVFCLPFHQLTDFLATVSNTAVSIHAQVLAQIDILRSDIAPSYGYCVWPFQKLPEFFKVGEQPFIFSIAVRKACLQSYQQLSCEVISLWP